MSQPSISCSLALPKTSTNSSQGHRCPASPHRPHLSGSPAANAPLLQGIRPKGGSRTSGMHLPEDENGQHRQSNRQFWKNRRSVVGLLFISLFLLAGSFALFDSLLDDDESGGEGEEVQLASDDDAKDYLNRFGYVGAQSQVGQDVPRVQEQHSPGRTASDLVGDLALDSLKSAISQFQEFAGLPSTGVLDNRTRKKMAQPRCGMQDVQMLGSGGYVPKWRKRQLTYRFLHFSRDLPESAQRQAVQMAFDLWSKHVPLEFSESDSSSADIRVRFATRSHGDPWPFDGKGGVLAHATFPTDGQLHFDDDENWAYMDVRKIRSYRYTDLLWVAIHEIGHVLGLSHSNVESAIMAPFYQDPENFVDWRGNYKTPELTSDDIRAAQQIYGKRYGDTNRNGGRGRGTYDDEEGGFLSRLGKFLEGDGDNNEQGEEENNGYGSEDDETHRRQGHRTTHARRHNHHEEEEEDGAGSVFGAFFSAGHSVVPYAQMLLVIPLAAAVFCTFH